MKKFLLLMTPGIVLAFAPVPEKPSPIRIRVARPARLSGPTLIVQPAAPASDGGTGAVMTAASADTGTACYSRIRHTDQQGSQLTAAHESLPVGSRVEVKNLRNQRSVTVTITGHGSFPNRIISVDQNAAEQLGFVQDGTAPVKLKVLGD